MEMSVTPEAHFPHHLLAMVYTSKVVCSNEPVFILKDAQDRKLDE